MHLCVQILVVLFKASVPQCWYVVSTAQQTSRTGRSSEAVKLWCAVTFRGNIAPLMHWTNSAGSRLTDNVDNETLANNSVTYSLTLDGANVTNGSSYTCTTYFERPSVSDKTLATNAPDFIDICTLFPILAHRSTLDDDQALNELSKYISYYTGYSQN